MLNNILLTKAKRIVFVAVFMSLAFLGSCASSPPKQKDNLCAVFDEKNGWYKDAKKASQKWHIPIATNMAIMHQESRFVAKAKPDRKKYLGFIPGPRKSSAYGYSQAKKDTWKWYKEKSGHRGADRNDFDDAIDFIAWYNNMSATRLGIPRHDTYSLYLAYHEGHGGYERRTYKNKAWLLDVARKVNHRAQQYNAQLQKCEKRLDSSWWPF